MLWPEYCLWRLARCLVGSSKPSPWIKCALTLQYFLKCLPQVCWVHTMNKFLFLRKYYPISGAHWIIYISCLIPLNIWWVWAVPETKLLSQDRLSSFRRIFFLPKIALWVQTYVCVTFCEDCVYHSYPLSSRISTPILASNIFNSQLIQERMIMEMTLVMSGRMYISYQLIRWHIHIRIRKYFSNEQRAFNAFLLPFNAKISAFRERKTGLFCHCHCLWSTGLFSLTFIASNF